MKTIRDVILEIVVELIPLSKYLIFLALFQTNGFSDFKLTGKTWVILKDMNNLDYDSAQKACEKLKLSLATEEQIIQANNAGLMKAYPEMKQHYYWLKTPRSALSGNFAYFFHGHYRNVSRFGSRNVLGGSGICL